MKKGDSRIMKERFNIIHQGSVIPINDVIKIGRDSSNDVVINDPYVSRSHCIIRKKSEDSLIIEDLDSSNGSFLITNLGEVCEIKGKQIFDSLEKINPTILLLGKSVEIEFFFPSLKTASPEINTKPITIGVVKEPGVLNFENILHMNTIYPNAAAVMLRRMLEEKLRIILEKDQKDYMDLREMINTIKNNYNLTEEIYRAMEKIRHTGNAGAHKRYVSQQTIEDCIKLFHDINSSLP